jgi:hypothetical protein
MHPLTIDVEPLAFAQVDEEWLPGLKPYVYQSQVSFPRHAYRER